MDPSPSTPTPPERTTTPSSTTIITIMTSVVTDRRCLLLLFVTTALCITIAVTSFNLGVITVSPTSTTNLFSSSLNSLFQSSSSSSTSSNTTTPTFVESKLASSASTGTGSSRGQVPRLAYLVSGSKGDINRLWRTLRALYHPRNLYVVHLDLESPVEERAELARRVESDPTFASVGNVKMIVKANMVTYRGPTMVSNTLHACAVLLKWSQDWDWFINLSASDYPLVTQDELLHAFSFVPRNLNFIEHTSRLGWKADQRARPLIIDPGLYSATKSDIFWTTQKRSIPTAFKLYTGSAWMTLSRDFVDYTIWGYDNLPRTLLMYYSNFVSSPEGYFQTIICNTPEFNSTAVNHDLHLIMWDVPPKQHPHVLTVNDTGRIVRSNAPFARKFGKEGEGDKLLDWVDKEILGREKDGFTPGGWCSSGMSSQGCDKVGDVGKVVPGKGVLRVTKLLDRIVRSDWFKKNQCI